MATTRYRFIFVRKSALREPEAKVIVEKRNIVPTKL